MITHILMLGFALLNPSYDPYSGDAGSLPRSQAAQPTTHVYPKEISQTYQKLCIQESIASGFSSQQADQLCRCIIEQLQNQYSLNEFLEIYTRSNETGEPPDEFVDAGLTCAEQLTANP
ncbi:MAG: hypothetical protein ACFBSC_20670 [Microcoleaceae cyanobacterium]